MDGFVKSYSGVEQATRQPIVMGYFTGSQVPASDFFAANYAICDAWFASLPASTQPNRLMAAAWLKIQSINPWLSLARNHGLSSRGR
jgi:phospholipase C